MEEVFKQTNKSLSSSGLFRVKKAIKKESYDWWMNMAKNGYEYLHEFKERVDEIIWLQWKHHEIIDKFADNPNPKVVQDSLEELHRLNITLSNYFDVAPEIKARSAANQFGAEQYKQLQELVNLKEEVQLLRDREKQRESSLSQNQIVKQEEKEEEEELMCYCDGTIMQHYECGNCHKIWCAKDKTKEPECPSCKITV